MILQCWEDHDQRFEKMFSHLRCLKIVEFKKILRTNIDMLLFSNMDQVFKIAAPAAIK